MLSQLVRNQRFVNEDGQLIERPLKWTQDVTSLQILSDSGSPEGVVEATSLRQYMDTVGAVGNVLYIKQKDDINGDRTKGWVLIG